MLSSCQKSVFGLKQPPRWFVSPSVVEVPADADRKGIAVQPPPQTSRQAEAALRAIGIEEPRRKG